MPEDKKDSTTAATTTKDKRAQDPTNKSKKDKKKEELNEEDQKLRDELESFVVKCTPRIPEECIVVNGIVVEKQLDPLTGLPLSVEPEIPACNDKEVKVIQEALDSLASKLKEASSTMTSVPKPLKFLRVHYETMKKYYESQKKSKSALFNSSNSKTKMLYSDILSVLAAVKSPPKKKLEDKSSSGDVEMKDAKDSAGSKKDDKTDSKVTDSAAKDSSKPSDNKDSSGSSSSSSDNKDSTEEKPEKSIEEKEKEREEEKKKREEGPYIPEINPYEIDTQKECLKYRLEGTPHTETSKFSDWGHEYVRHLSGEILYCYRSIMSVEEEEDGMEVEDDSPPPYKPKLTPPDDSPPPYKPEVSQLFDLVDIIVPFQLEQQEEVAAIDLLYEMDQLHKIPGLCSKDSYHRIALYLLSSSSYCPGGLEESRKILKIVYKINLKFNRFPEALRMALKIRNRQMVKDVFSHIRNLPSDSTFDIPGPNPNLKLIFDDKTKEAIMIQLAYILRQSRFDWKDEENWSEKVLEAASGETWYKKFYLALAKEIDVVSPKLPEDIYKSHLEEGNQRNVIDSAKMNLASTYVNGFVNAGFGKDKLMSVGEVWLLQKNKEHGMLAAAASRCLISLWDPDVLDEVDKYQYSNESYVKAGYFLGLGVAMTSIRAETDPVWALCMETIEGGGANEGDSDGTSSGIREKLAAVLGLGFAYCGTGHEEIVENLTPVVVDVEAPIELAAISALTIGMVMLGTAHQDLIGAIIATLEERMKLKGQLDSPVATLFSGALGLLMLGVQEGGVNNANGVPLQEGEEENFNCSPMEVESSSVQAQDPGTNGCSDAMTLTALLDMLKSTITHPLGLFTSQLLIGFAYCGSGDVLQIQKLMGTVAVENKFKDSKSKEEEDAKAAAAITAAQSEQDAKGEKKTDGNKEGDSNKDLGSNESCPAGSAALLSIAAIACGGDDIGREMCMRMIDHILQYGNITLKRTVPLSIGLLYISNAKQQAIDLLSKLSHDQDQDVALSAVFAMGLCGAGTNHAKIAGLLRQLAAFYSSEPNILFIVRIAQGLLYLGKGLLTLSPLHSDKTLINQPAFGSLLILLTVSLNANSLFFKNHMHWLLYYITPAIAPRMLITVDEETAEPISVSVRVGQAVDVVGQVGQPKQITGFQTHNTPVLLASGERAELATDEYISMTHVLEGVVVVRKNSEWKEEKK